MALLATNYQYTEKVPCEVTEMFLFNDVLNTFLFMVT